MVRVGWCRGWCPSPDEAESGGTGGAARREDEEAERVVVSERNGTTMSERPRLGRIWTHLERVSQLPHHLPLLLAQLELSHPVLPALRELVDRHTVPPCKFEEPVHGEFQRVAQYRSIIRTGSPSDFKSRLHFGRRRVEELRMRLASLRSWGTGDQGWGTKICA